LRGVVILLVILVVAGIFCGAVPFWILPQLETGVALPVVSVPGEKLWEDVSFVLFDFTITNTIIGTLLADVIVLLFAFGATRNMQDIPGRLQGLFEVLTDALYGLAKSTAGINAKKIFPLMASIFLFLLVANWLELVPGVDSIGLMHCAEDGFSGYEAKDWAVGQVLKVDAPLKQGIRATEADYEACHAAEEGHLEEEHTDEAIAGEDTGDSAEVAAAEAGGQEISVPTDREVRDDIHIVTPFVRAAATDLNLTLGLGLFAFIAIQVFGVQALGVGYFAKFINTPALGNLQKKPMGAMDFVVGLLEIISELAKIVSFGFRLFGNIFAGQVLLFVMTFLVATLLPAVFYGLELFVGLIQAFVFAMLLLVFSTIAMAGHGHDDVEHH
jgi:F-type H+-transporting ATPase subunit a